MLIWKSNGDSFKHALHSSHMVFISSVLKANYFVLTFFWIILFVCQRNFDLSFRWYFILRLVRIQNSSFSIFLRSPNPRIIKHCLQLSLNPPPPNCAFVILKCFLTRKKYVQFTVVIKKQPLNFKKFNTGGWHSVTASLIPLKGQYCELQ